MVNIKKFPHGILDQVISKRTCDGESERAPGPGLKLQAASTKHQANQNQVQVQAPSIKRQAAIPEAQASSFKPQAASFVILEPRYKKTEEVFLGKGPRAFTMINVLCG